MQRHQPTDHSLTTGGIYSVLFSVSVPLIVNNIMMSFYNLADGLWVAQLSMLEFTATSFVWPPHYLFVSLGMGLSIAGTAIIAQLLGQKEQKGAEAYATHLFLLCTVLGALLSVLGYVLAPSIVVWMGASGELAAKSQIYLAILLLGYCFELVYLALSSILGAQGKTRVTTIIGMASSILNVFLDPFFIFGRIPLLGLPGLGLGIAGAAWATVLSQAVKVVLGSFAIRAKHNLVRLRFKGLPLEGRKFLELIRTGLPTALGQGSAAIGFTLLNTVIVAYGEATMTAYAAVNRISSFLMMPAQGIGSSLTAIIGQNIGAGERERVRAFVRSAFIVVSAMAASGGLIQWIFRYPMLSLFLKDPAAQAVWEQAIEYSLYSALLTPLMGYFGLFGGIFSGCGYQNYSAYMAVARLWFIRLPMIYLFQKWTNIGSTAVWIAMLASNVLIDIYGYWLYGKKKWFNEPRLRH